MCPIGSFVDCGYMDMYQVVKTLQEVAFKGVIIPDHIPQMVGDGQDARRTGMAYTIAYMQAYVERAEAEVGRG